MEARKSKQLIYTHLQVFTDSAFEQSVRPEIEAGAELLLVTLSTPGAGSCAKKNEVKGQNHYKKLGLSFFHAAQNVSILCRAAQLTQPI